MKRNRHNKFDFSNLKKTNNINIILQMCVQNFNTQIEICKITNIFRNIEQKQKMCSATIVFLFLFLFSFIIIIFYTLNQTKDMESIFHFRLC